MIKTQVIERKKLTTGFYSVSVCAVKEGERFILRQVFADRFDEKREWFTEDYVCDNTLQLRMMYKEYDVETAESILDIQRRTKPDYKWN